MQNSFITLENVCDAAALLATVNTYSIKQEVIEDAEDFIVELKTALDNFNNPFSRNTSDGYYSSPRIFFDKHLSALLNATKNLYEILTDDAKEIVRRCIENKKLMKEAQGNEQ